MENKPQGFTYLTAEEKALIRLLREREYSARQIALMTGRSKSTVKRLIYNK